MEENYWPFVALIEFAIPILILFVFVYKKSLKSALNTVFGTKITD